LDFKISVIAIAGIFAVLLVSGPSPSFSQTGDSVQIPDWMKNNAKWWAEGNLSDGEFVDALEFLIKEKIIKSPEISVLDVVPSDILEEKTQVAIPSWIKNDAKAWPLGQITDSDFLEGIKFLIKEEIIRSPKIQIRDTSSPKVPTDTTPKTITDQVYQKTYEDTLMLLENKSTQSTGTGNQKPYACARLAMTTDDRIEAEMADLATDSDLDGITDDKEIEGYFGHVTDPNNRDTDGDGLSDFREFWWKTNPLLPDTNDDGIKDGPSVDGYDEDGTGVYPYAGELSLSVDRDRDGIPLMAEKFDILTDETLFSTDGDRYGDGEEFFKIYSGEGMARRVTADPHHPSVVDIEITPLPEVTLLMGQTLTIGDMKMTKDVDVDSYSEETADTHSFTATETFTESLKVSYDTSSGGKFEASAELKLEQSWQQKTSTTTSSKFEQTQSTIREAYRESKTAVGEGTNLKMDFLIDNVGYDISTTPLSEIWFNFYLGSDEISFLSKPLTVDATEGATFTNLFPNTQPMQLTMTDVKLNLPNFYRFIAGEGVRTQVSHFSFGEDQIYLENAKASTLQLILISEQGVTKKFVYLPTTMNLEELLLCEDIDYDRDPVSGKFTSINGMDVDIKEGSPPYKNLKM